MGIRSLYCHVGPINEVVMARPLPLEFAGAIYHLTSCGNARQKVFFSDAVAFRLALPRLLTRCFLSPPF